MNVLVLKGIQHKSAVLVLITDIYIFPFKQLAEDTTSYLAEISRYDSVEIRGFLPVSLKN